MGTLILIGHGFVSFPSEGWLKTSPANISFKLVLASLPSRS